MRKRLLFTLFAILFCSTMFGQNYYVPVNTGQYSTSTTIISVISFDGVEQGKELELGVFCNDEVRASVRTSYNPVRKRYIATVSVKGQSGDAFKFKVYDHSTNTEWSNDCTITYVDKNGVTKVAQYLTFDSENGYGSSTQPCTINFNAPLHWIPNTSFDNAMIVSSTVKIDNITQQNSGYELGVFCGDEVRGSAELNNDGTVNAIVYGVAGEVFTFNLYDPNKGEGFDNNGELIFNEVNNITFNQDGYFNLEVNFITASYVAQIDDAKYTSFEAALEAAVDGNEIILLENITLEENPTVVSKDININLNSKTVSGTIKLAHTGATVTGVAEAMTVTSGVEGYIVVCENNVYSLSERQPSGKVAYRAYINDSESREAVQVDLTNVYAKTSFVVELLDANDNVLTTTSLKAGKVNAESYTCNIVLEGTASGSWDTEIKASKLTVANIPATINVYADGTLVDTYANALGAGTNVDETEKYKALDCVYKEAKIGETLYATFAAAYEKAATGNEIILLANVDFAETTVEKAININLNSMTVTGTIVLANTDATVTCAEGAVTVTTNVAGYEVVYDANAYKLVRRQASAEVAYRAYVHDTDSFEGVAVDLANVYAEQSLKVELYSGEQLLTSTTYAKNFPVDAETFTCLIVLDGTADEYWNTTIECSELTVANIPTTIKVYVYADDNWVHTHTYNNALGAGTNVDETEDYKALDCVLDTPVAKVGNTEYYNINNAIANWTAGSTLTLLADVTLSDVITLKSTEHHILNLDTYTMTAAEGKNAIEITPEGAGTAAKQCLTINADSENPGGITATSKSCIYYKKTNGINDRLMVTINGGVFNGSYSINSSSNNGGQACPYYLINGGTFNGNVSLTKAMLKTTGGIFNGWVNCTGDSTAHRLIAGGTFKTWQFMTADAPNKFAVGTNKQIYDLGVYIDDNGYLVVGGPVITEEGITFEASAGYDSWKTDNYFNNFFYYLQYSSAATNGLYYTSAEEALADNNKTNGSVNIYTDELDLTSLNYKGTLVIEDDLTVTFNEGITPAWSVVAKEEGKIVVYTDDIENEIVKRTYSVIVPVAKIGDDKFFASLEAAIAAATDECTIDLLADVEVSNPLLFSFNSAFDKIDVTFNGNGKTIKAVGTAWNDNIWLADIAWNVTLNNVTFDGNNTGCKGVQFYTSESTLNNITVKNISADKWGITDYAIHANASELTVIGSLTFENCKHGMLMVDLGNNTGKEASVVSIDNNATVNGVKVILNHKDASLEAPASAANYVSMGNVPGYTMVYENGVYKLVAIEVQTITLEERWNWVSHYVVGNTDSDILAQLQNGLGAYGVQIKNQNDFTDYGTDVDGNTGWFGQLITTSVKEMYKVNTSLAIDQTLQVELSGVLVDPAQDQYHITLVENWNYIGYPLNEDVSVGTVFANVAKDGDYVKSQDAFAEYYSGTWHGNLKTMKPGEGYMYRNIPVENVDVTKTLVYSYPNAKEATEANITSENNYWVPTSSQYADNMTMVAMLDVKGGDYEVAAFVGGEVRGSARPVYIESLDAYMFFLTIHGDEVAEMTFKVYDLATGEEYSIDNRMNYSDDAVVGSVRNPYMLTCSTLAIGENNISNISIYPNPTTTGNEINLGTECDTVEVFNALGVKVAEYQNVDTVDALETAGIYVIRITNDGNVQNCRLIVK